MIKKLLSYAKGYGIYAFLSPLAIVFEVLIEVAIPFLMSVIVNPRSSPARMISSSVMAEDLSDFLRLSSALPSFLSLRTL